MWKGSSFSVDCRLMVWYKDACSSSDIVKNDLAAF